MSPRTAPGGHENQKCWPGFRVAHVSLHSASLTAHAEMALCRLFGTCRDGPVQIVWLLCSQDSVENYSPMAAWHDGLESSAGLSSATGVLRRGAFEQIDGIFMLAIC